MFQLRARLLEFFDLLGAAGEALLSLVLVQSEPGDHLLPSETLLLGHTRALAECISRREGQRKFGILLGELLFDIGEVSAEHLSLRRRDVGAGFQRLDASVELGANRLDLRILRGECLVALVLVESKLGDEVLPLEPLLRRRGVQELGSERLGVGAQIGNLRLERGGFGLGLRDSLVALFPGNLSLGERSLERGVGGGECRFALLPRSLGVGQFRFSVRERVPRRLKLFLDRGELGGGVRRGRLRLGRLRLEVLGGGVPGGDELTHVLRLSLELPELSLNVILLDFGSFQSGVCFGECVFVGDGLGL